MDAQAQSASVRTVPVVRGTTHLWRQRLFPYLLVMPTLVFVILFTLLPAMRTVVDSTMEPGRRASDPFTFVGLDNYTDLFNPSHYLGSRFTRILGNTLIFSAVTLAVSIPLALIFAMLLNRPIRLMGIWRFSLFYPSLLPLIGAASIWAFLYSDSIGLFNTILHSLGLPTVNWLGDPNTVLGSVIVMNIWKQTGYYMIFFLAGLQSIPRDIYEAAALDGASFMQQFFSLTLPLLRRTTLFVMVVSTIFAFQTVEQLQALNMGNPADRGNLLLYFIFQNIGERRNWGYINAMTVILVAILLVFTISNFIFFEKGQEDE
ncbi:MAG: sugar ABC transporter permease [Anaerolineaceae bacterium]|nr:sugar ABC transporter permease [Anaerolineaceae bacterium]